MTASGHHGISAAQRSHPRRQPAHLSVSLLHSLNGAEANGSSKDSTPSSDDLSTRAAALSDAPSSLQPLHGKPSSGESSGAEGWFTKANDQRLDNNAPVADNDPPFFMRNSSSYESPPERYPGQSGSAEQNAGQPLAFRPGLVHVGTDGSSTEEYRGVIDDLTIENKKLKRRLKKYEKLHDSHLKDDKLFEVRVHGLPIDKKRELEELLRTFASNMTAPAGNEFPANGYNGIPKVKHAASSLTSLHNNDSAYASMSASGQGSSARSGSDVKHNSFTPTTRTKQRNVHSYLHHIPENLLPQNPASLSERAKKKLIVGSLEQIFSGKGALAGPHHQALQQEHVSQMAARADRAEHVQGHLPRTKEGAREANMMPKDTEDANDSTTTRMAQFEGDATDALNRIGDERVAEQDFANKSPEHVQRPTRPMDLDLDRAQVPADNVRYIRHLGFSPLDVESGRSPEEGHGWIYLNVLINMAQLHTYHVTVDFVCKALTECSERFEVSSDGRKVRWKGAARKARAARDIHDGNDDAEQSPRKKLKRAHEGTPLAGASIKASEQATLATKANKLVYTPLFHHRSSTDESDESSEEYEDSRSSGYPQPPGGESSAMTSSGIRTATAPVQKRKKRSDGPIIFYNNAGFCTDLSSDRDAIGNRNAPVYRTTNVSPIGKPRNQKTEEYLELRGPLDQANALPEPMEIGDNPISNDMELTFPEFTTPKSRSSPPALHPDFEVTGMGGVYPADHFAVSVESRHAIPDQISSSAVASHNAAKRPLRKFAAILDQKSKHGPQAPVSTQILRVKRMDHAPSKLPPASCYMPSGDDSMSDEESEIDDDDDSAPRDSQHIASPATVPQTIGYSHALSDTSDTDMGDAEDDSDDESDGSLDLLAAARELDPEAVRQQEREYDAIMADRLAEEIPAGSSAATAGGGSGFASPVVNMGEKQYQQAVRDARKPPA